MSDVVQEPGTMRATTGTEYLVLEQHETLEQGGNRTVWEPIETCTARNSDEAIKRVAGENDGMYVAVPARAWTPRKVTVKTERRVQLS